jgi:sortase A
VSWERPDDRHGRTAVFLLVAAILVATALAVALVAGAASRSSNGNDVILRDAPVTEGTTPRAKTAGPASMAQDPRAEAPVTGPFALATVSVPANGLETAVYEGVTTNVLDLGPGHWPGTAAPGGFGNLVIVGHRSTSNRALERIGELVPGDRIVVADLTGTYTYVVEGSEVIAFEGFDALARTSRATASLVAAHPPRTEGHRYVVRAGLVSAPRPAGV